MILPPLQQLCLKSEPTHMKRQREDDDDEDDDEDEGEGEEDYDSDDTPYEEMNENVLHTMDLHQQLYDGIREENPDLIKIAIARGAPLGPYGSRLEDPAILYAIQEGCADCVRALLEGAPVLKSVVETQKTVGGPKAWSDSNVITEYPDDPEKVWVSANANEHHWQITTPLIEAIRGHDARIRNTTDQIVNLLLEYGADPTITAKFDKVNAFDVAEEYKRPDYVDLFEQKFKRPA